ncbi:hypothetical protein MP638_003698 [Amoeboaphelidium occidentale]|nr:hypothetical protein MP638_003698 [Amoeboaphelidium occidentale]
MLKDSQLGSLIIFTSTLLFTYYSIWLLVMPFVDEGHALHDLFPSKRYLSTSVPVVLFMIIPGVIVSSFLSFVLIHSG